MAGGLPVRQGRCWISRKERRICEGLLQGITQPEGRIRHRRLQGSQAQAAAGIPDSDRVSGEAKPDHGDMGEYHLRSTEREPEGELGARHDEPHRPTFRARG
jgi:hypothetical protein